MDLRLMVSLIVLLMVFDGGVLIVIRFYLFRNVTNVTTHLDKMSDDYTKKNAETKKMLADAEEKSAEMLAAAEEEAADVKVRAAKESQMEREKILSDARKLSDQIVQQANKTRDFLLAELDRKIQDAAIVKASNLMRTVIPENLRRGVHMLQMKHMMNGGLEGISSDNLSVDSGEILVTTAYAMSEDERDSIHSQLMLKMGVGFDLRDEVDPGLLAGATISIEGLVIDGSLRHTIEEAAKNDSNATV